MPIPDSLSRDQNRLADPTEQFLQSAGTTKGQRGIVH